MHKAKISTDVPSTIYDEKKARYFDSDSRDSSPVSLDIDIEKRAAAAQQLSLDRKEGLWQRWVIDAGCVLMNTICTVCVVFANKRVFSDPQLANFQVYTAAWHFLATTLVLVLASSRPYNLFTAVRLPVLDILPISLLFVGFLVLGNLSLSVNTVAFYQISKILNTPAVVAINFVLFGTMIKMSMLAAVLVCSGGVMLTVSGAALSNSYGTMVAAAAFITTAFYQIWIGKKIGDLKVSAPQLLMNQAPLSVLLLLCIAPFVDTWPDFSLVPPKVIQMFLVSGFLAAGLNLSQFLIIGRTSALTFNIVSHAKNIIIISIGWYQTGKVIGVMDLVGVTLALGGASAYSWLCQTS